MTIRTAAYGDKGPRGNYEDACRAITWSDLGVSPGTAEVSAGIAPGSAVLLLGDGVGGEHSGEVASPLAVGTLAVHLSANLIGLGTIPKEKHPTLIIKALKDSCAAANHAILDTAAREPRLAGMASTIVAAVIHEGELFVAWAGDSRCYLFRGDFRGRGQTLRRITHDHSHVQRLIDEGVLSPSAAKDHPLAHVIHKCLGRAEGGDVEVVVEGLQPGDFVVLTSDGMTDVFADDELERMLAAMGDEGFALRDYPRILVDAALDRGTLDNTTVLVARYGVSIDADLTYLEPTLIGAYPVTLSSVLRRTS